MIAAVQAIPGVGPGAITTGRISVREITRDERELYRASEGISVALGQPDRAGELITAAIGAGATGIRGPNFFPSDPERAYRNTLLEAFDLAYQRAAALAIRAGSVLGPAITIEETSEITPAPAAAAPRKRGRAEDAPPVKPGGSTVTATVRVAFRAPVAELPGIERGRAGARRARRHNRCRWRSLSNSHEGVTSMPARRGTRPTRH